VPSRHWPGVLAIAVALRRSWRHGQLTTFAQRLGVSLPKSDIVRERLTAARSRPSRSRCSGSPRPRQGSSLRSDPARRGSRP
jgi:hypothetical protein